MWHRLSLAGAFNDPARRADFRTELTALQHDLLNYTRALAEVERGIACYVSSPRQDAIGYLINVRGLVLLAQGRIREAADDFVKKGFTKVGVGV